MLFVTALFEEFLRFNKISVFTTWQPGSFLYGFLLTGKTLVNDFLTISNTYNNTQ